MMPCLACRSCPAIGPDICAMFQGHLRGIDAWVSVTVQGAQRLLSLLRVIDCRRRYCTAPRGADGSTAKAGLTVTGFLTHVSRISHTRYCLTKYECFFTPNAAGKLNTRSSIDDRPTRCQCMRDCLGENLHLYYPYITRIFIYPYIIDTSNFCAIVFVPRPSLGFVCQQCLTFVVSVQCYALLSRISFFLRAFACAFVLLLCSVLHFRFPSAVSFPTLSIHDPVPKLTLFAPFHVRFWRLCLFPNLSTHYPVRSLPFWGFEVSQQYNAHAQYGAFPLPAL